MRNRVLLSSVAIATLLASAPAAFAADWSVSNDAAFYIDASVTHQVTPDMVNMTVDCQLPKPMTRADIRAEQKEYMEKLVDAAGASAHIRRNGSLSLYPNVTYNPETGVPEAGDGTYSGSIGYIVQMKDSSNAQALADAIDEMGCTYTWDPRLVYTGTYATQNQVELLKQINEKKAFYEQLLGIKLSIVSNVSVSTMIDSGNGYYGIANPYDPETNTVGAVTTMSVTFQMQNPTKKN